LINHTLLDFVGLPNRMLLTDGTSI